MVLAPAPSTLPSQVESPEPPMHSQQVSDTSRLSGVWDREVSDTRREDYLRYPGKNPLREPATARVCHEQEGPLLRETGRHAGPDKE
jgi:hypothetical protein